MTQKQKAQEILIRLRLEYPNAYCELTHNTAWQLLVATILSAQCTDVRVNKVTPSLFEAYGTAEDINNMDIELLKEYIHSTGFYNNKAKNIKGAALLVINEYDGIVPDNMQDLLCLPGVARKTANVVLSNWFHKNEGVVVDTHVRRLANRYGLTREQKNTAKIEKDLMKLYDQKDWGQLSHLLIFHGRAVATACNPRDEDDVLAEFIVR